MTDQTDTDALVARAEATRLRIKAGVIANPPAHIEVIALRQKATAQAAQIAALTEHLTRIADLPDPGEDQERSATFYRIHIGNLKQIAAKGLGRQTVSDEAMAWACSPKVVAEIEAPRAALETER